MTSLMSACYPSWAEFFALGDLLEDFEEIENVFNITSKLVKEHSDELLSVICLENSPPSCARPVLSHDQVGEGKSMCPC